MLDVRSLSVIAVFSWIIGGTWQHASCEEPLEFFERRVRPVLVTHCYECHSGDAKKLQAGLRVDHRDFLLQGGDSGPSLIPGKPNESLLIQAVRYDGYEMPPRSKLPADAIEALEKWVELGAPWPQDPKPSNPTSKNSPKDSPPNSESKFNLTARRDSHWCWQPIQKTSPTRSSSTSTTDGFIEEALAAANLQATSPATPTEWARRVALDLTGLFPDSERLSQFLNDARPYARQRFIDRLLADPAMGEHWARYWLDVVRYAESRGHEFDPDIRGARHYRDYVIRAWNQDLPYRTFVTEQIAGDLLDVPRIDTHKGYNESLIATGFWHLGEWVHSPVDTARDESDRIDNMIDTFSKTFLGITVACARCHDHKFDAISTDDYYSLATLLKCSEFREVRFQSAYQNHQVAQRLQSLQDAWQTPLKAKLIELARAEITRIASTKELDELYSASMLTPYIERLQSTSPPQTLSNHFQNRPWLVDGVVYGLRPLPAGFLAIDGASSPALHLPIAPMARRDDFWNELRDTPDPVVDQRSRLDTHTRAGRTWRTETFELKEPTLHYLVRGSGTAFVCIDSHRQIFGPLHGNTVLEFKPPEKSGTEKSGTEKSGTEKQVPAEPYWVTHRLDRYVGCWTHVEMTPRDAAGLEILDVCQTRPAETPKNGKLREPITPLLVSESLKQVIAGLEQSTWSDASLKLGSWWIDRLSQWGPRHEEAFAMFTSELNHWQAKRLELKSHVIKESPLAPAMWDGTRQPNWVSIRGNPHAKGRETPPKRLEAFGGELAEGEGSGRDFLAQSVIFDQNPLTWRVMANRLWQQCMGRGIVGSPDDFGVLGEKPTHLALLDHLATELRDHDSSKRLLRELVQTDVYGRSCRPLDASLNQDPDNRLWHYRPPRRMTGEMVRDNLLLQSGRLVHQAPGPSIPLHLTEFMDGRGRPSKSGPIDGEGKRSIYLAVRRNFLSPMLVAFDLPSPTVTRGRRSLSNVPAQALTMLNDPLVQELSILWGKQLSTTSDPEATVAQMIRATFGRNPKDAEIRAACEFVKAQSTEHDPATAWTALAHVLWNTKEFLFIP